MHGKLTFYYNPMSRAAIVRWMLEEVGADYEIVPIDFEAGENRKPTFLAINPMGKLPTIVLPDGTVVTEVPAIIAWLADAYPDAGLAPEPGSAERGTYYRWLFFGGACFEPALTDTMMRKDAPPLPKSSIGWGSYDDVIDTLEIAIGTGRIYWVNASARPTSISAPSSSGRGCSPPRALPKAGLSRTTLRG